MSKAHHEFLPIGESPYCGFCALPRANRRHQAPPRTWTVRVTTYDLQGSETKHFGPFPDEEEANTYADFRRDNHTEVEVLSLENPALAKR